MPQKHLSKSKLSMFLRTGCDRELYLSLHTDGVLANTGLPVPLRARPGIGVLKQAGNDFEDAKNAEIVVAFPGLVFGNGNGGIATDDLSQLLAHALHSPTFVLQGRFQPQQFRALALSNLGLNQQAQALVPPLDGMIPDIIVARASIPGEEMVSPDGTRQVVQAGEQRLALVVIDIKHASEPKRK